MNLIEIDDALARGLPLFFVLNGRRVEIDIRQASVDRPRGSCRHRHNPVVVAIGFLATMAMLSTCVAIAGPHRSAPHAAPHWPSGGLSGGGGINVATGPSNPAATPFPPGFGMFHTTTQPSELHP